jgi:hypothetical protein
MGCQALYNQHIRAVTNTTRPPTCVSGVGVQAPVKAVCYVTFPKPISNLVMPDVIFAARSRPSTPFAGANGWAQALLLDKPKVPAPDLRTLSVMHAYQLQ